MKKFLVFISGMITGALLLYSVLYIISSKSEYSKEEQLRQQLINIVSTGLSNSFDTQKQETEIQHIEVRGKLGRATVHTEMIKDSVRILLGKPDDVKMHTIGQTTYEDWGYKIKNRHISDLNVNFQNGRLKGISQH